jgi:phosphoglycerol transferase MdoB-like AlkP superfamily enzyme
VRTEFAFLSGLESDSLGVHRFNPYRRLAQQGLPTLARFLRQLGYRTVCVHPYPAGFYSRNKVFPLLGIDEFIDIRSLGGVKKSGPYVGDIPLGEKACSLMEMYARRSEPVFLFVITMENHGPLHLERITPDEINRYYANPLPAGCDDLIVYLRHLVNADRMVGMLREYLESIAINNWFCFFGDHAPIMPKVYDILGTPDRRTNYVVWNKMHTLDRTIAHDMKVENLGALLLRNMGLPATDHYLAAS